MCLNFSLNISIQVSTTIGSQLLSTPDPEQSNSLVRSLERWDWVEKAMWHRSSMQVVGSRTDEFPNPPPPGHAMHVKTFGA
jgi:hypothetical protein